MLPKASFEQICWVKSLADAAFKFNSGAFWIKITLSLSGAPHSVDVAFTITVPWNPAVQDITPVFGFILPAFSLSHDQYTFGEDCSSVISPAAGGHIGIGFANVSVISFGVSSALDMS